MGSSQGQFSGLGQLLLKGPARSVVLAPAAPAWPPPACPVQVSASAWLHSAFSAAPGTAGTSSPPLTDAPSNSSKQTLSNGRVWLLSVWQSQNPPVCQGDPCSCWETTCRSPTETFKPRIVLALVGSLLLLRMPSASSGT